MIIHKPPQKAPQAKPKPQFKVAPKVEATDTRSLVKAGVIPNDGDSIMDLVIGGLAANIRKLDKALHAERGIDLQEVELTRQVKVEIARPSFAMAQNMDSFALFESLINVVTSCYPLLVKELSRSASQEYFLGEAPKKNPIDYRVQIMLKAAEKLLIAQGWVKIQAIESWQAPAFMGADLMVCETEMKNRFADFAKLQLNQKLLK